MTKEETVTEGSKILWDKGVRILQGNRLGPTDKEHVARLAKYMELNGERQIADMGCGFGEVSRILSEKLPKTQFWLVNNDLFQLRHCPDDPRFVVCHDQIHATSIPTRSIDLVMFNYSLCLVDPLLALTEAHRIARFKGRLFVYDYQRLGGNNELTRQHLFAYFLTDKEFRGVAKDAGWHDVDTMHPGGDDTLFREAAAGDDALYDSMFKDLIPVIWRAVR